VSGDATWPVKVVVAVIGLDQHEVGSMMVSKILSEAGMEVVYLGRFNTPDSVVRAAISEDADVVGVSCHSWEFLEFAPELATQLTGHGIPLVLGGSLLTSGDTEQLLAAGVHALVGPGTPSEEVVAVVEAAAADRRSRTGA
jgi:methylmalonyl-CoA mutase C-terminal domain/subunit